MNKHLFAGIDSGSTTTNMVVLMQTKPCSLFSIVRTGPRAQMGAQAALEDVCRTTEHQKRISFPPSSRQAMAETTFPSPRTPGRKSPATRARGAYFLNPAVRTIIDIGGQDSKIINLMKPATSPAS